MNEYNHVLIDLNLKPNNIPLCFSNIIHNVKTIWTTRNEYYLILLPQLIISQLPGNGNLLPVIPLCLNKLEKSSMKPSHGIFETNTGAHTDQTHTTSDYFLINSAW